MKASPVVHVAVAVIHDAAGRVLIAQRLPHQHLAGLWEFPGGKLEPGETLAEGLRREIGEELGIRVAAIAPLLRIEHAYPGKTVLLDVWRITRWTGEPPGTQGAEGQSLRWVHPDDMHAEEFPPADVAIIAALRLPPRYVISPDLSDMTGVDVFLAALARRAARQLPDRLVQVRLKKTPALAPALIAGIRRALPAARVLINSDTLAGLSATGGLHGADGLHLTARALHAWAEKPAVLPVEMPIRLPAPLSAASCHNAGDLARAFSLGIDFATLSPVLATASHADALPLGWASFAQLAAGAGLPVYALGGMRDALLDDALAQGAIGIAGISAMLD